MSLRFEQPDPLIKSEYGLPNGFDQDNEDDLDILDEFLDKRFYEDSIPSKDLNNVVQQVSPSMTTNTPVNKDDDMFKDFLTDEINKNDFIVFSPTENNPSGNSSMEMDLAQLGDLSQPLPDLNLAATTPISIDNNSPAAKSEIFHTPNSIDTNESSYENARQILSSLKFGTETPTQYDGEFPKEYIDIDSETLPYKLTLSNLPTYSRVETQIKLDLSVSPPPPQFLVHLPKDTIAKQKFCLSSPLPEDVKPNILSLETFVMTATTMKPCNTCSRCVRREQKRASRRKSGVSDNLNWTTNTNKRAIIFNCKEIISFPPTSMIESSKSIDISARIVCYCRHHTECKGFRLLFILKDFSGEIIAKHLSTPIMIMDRKKTSDENNNATGTINSDTNIGSQSNSNGLKSQPLSPTSIEEDSSEPHTTDSRVFKRKKTWSPELSDGFSITPQRKSSSGINLPTSFSLVARAINPSTPIIQRIIPAQGPLRGGIEITLLGTNFKTGLNVKFGVNKALSTQCWSETTMVTYLPPASQPGQVIVTVDDPEQDTASENKGSSIFTYLDDTDRQMIELALQIVGLKMNGKLEDARNIARRIIHSESPGDSSMNSTPTNIASFNNSIEQLAEVNDEDLILKVIAILPSNPNLSICTAEAQTLLHLSCLKGYYRLVSSLLQKGARVDVRDITGNTPLHFASIAGDRKCIELLLSRKAVVSMKNNNGETAEDVANSNVLDLLRSQDVESVCMTRKFSSSSLCSSIFSLEEFDSGAHVSRMTADRLGFSDEDEYSNDEDIEASDEESGYSFDEADFESDLSFSGSFSRDELNTINPSTPNNIPTEGDSDKSIWNKVKNVFNNDELPKYDDLFPKKITSFTNKVISKRSVTTAPPAIEPSDSSSITSDTEDIFQKFFHQRKNIQNDKMLLFVWLPLLFMMIGYFILLNAGWQFEFKDNIKEFIRKSLGTIMLGNERFKDVMNKHLNQVNNAVTSVMNAS